jgi:hypothetical protein
MLAFILLPNQYIALFKIPHPGTKEDMDTCSSFNFVEVDKELLHLATAALFAVFFFF